MAALLLFAGHAVPAAAEAARPVSSATDQDAFYARFARGLDTTLKTYVIGPAAQAYDGLTKDTASPPKTGAAPTTGGFLPGGWLETVGPLAERAVSLTDSYLVEPTARLYTRLSAAAASADRDAEIDEIRATAGAAVDRIGFTLGTYVVDPVRQSYRQTFEQPEPVVLHRSELFLRTDPVDPYEPANRMAYGFNTTMRGFFLDPVSRVYKAITSRPVQVAISNFFANLREPITITSSLLQGEIPDAGTATARFSINTTLGFAGLLDPATEIGFIRKPRTLEELLCVYRIPPGPYVVLPVLGPATVRDATARITTNFLQYLVLGPIYWPYRIADITVQYADVRDRLKMLESISVDPYSGQKSVYLRLRRMNCEKQTIVDEQLFVY
ncbi:MAG: VacJ family lipoprotein [Rhodospirillales bacterium]|nr:VacJ family lipoprotein [Rhodospirillales bacterium]